MTDEPRRTYLFRFEGIAHGSSTVVCAAPVDLAAAVFGGGGDHDEEGVRRTFGGNAYFRNDETGERFLGVWGARNASRFRTALRCHASIVVVQEPPPARLLWWTSEQKRPARQTSIRDASQPKSDRSP